MERPMTLNEAAEYADLTPGALRIAARDGRLDAVKAGRDWLTTAAAVDAYLAGRVGGKDRKPTARPSRRPARPTAADEPDT